MRRFRCEPAPRCGLVTHGVFAYIYIHLLANWQKATATRENKLLRSWWRQYASSPSHRLIYLIRQVAPLCTPVPHAILHGSLGLRESVYYLDRLSCFCRARGHDQHSQTLAVTECVTSPHVAIGRIYAMRPKYRPTFWKEKIMVTYICLN